MKIIKRNDINIYANDIGPSALNCYPRKSKMLTLEISKNCRFLSVCADTESECIEIFTEQDTSEPIIKQQICLIDNNQKLPKNLGEFLGTVKFPTLCGSPVYHIYLKEKVTYVG
jgi:hypothetical protein